MMSRCQHRGDKVRIGPHTIHVGGKTFLDHNSLGGYDLLVNLTGQTLSGENELVVDWYDFAPPPPEIKEVLREQVIPALEEGKKVLMFCGFGHGRTGTSLAMLLALLEPEVADPVNEIRRRYCRHAVETLAQEQAVAALAAAIH